ncbi:hypothetical protein [Corynebacterium matruchotii]
MHTFLGYGGSESRRGDGAAWRQQRSGAAGHAPCGLGLGPTGVDHQQRRHPPPTAHARRVVKRLS